jgi:cytochrome c oxidase cbb3-type subunit 3
VNRVIMLLLLIAGTVVAQAPSPGAISGSGEKEEAVERGGLVFAGKCASCHGPNARGLTPATDLIRSTAVRKDEKGELIRPILLTGHLKPGPVKLTDAQTSDVIAWLHAQLYGAANRGTYEFLNILTGNPQNGRVFFEGVGGCSMCHSVTGDLAGIGEKYDPPVLQSLWLNPRRRRGVEAPKTARTVKLTPRSGPAVSGTLERIDEFNLVLRDQAGVYRSFALHDDEPRVEIRDPLQPHFDLYRRLTDEQLHDVTAYLATLK